jgi:hypothetical protein
MPHTQSKIEYLQLAFLCDERAASAKTEQERREFRNRAATFRRLANARLGEGGSSEAHFESTAKRKKARLSSTS